MREREKYWETSKWVPAIGRIRSVIQSSNEEDFGKTSKCWVYVIIGCINYWSIYKKKFTRDKDIYIIQYIIIVAFDQVCVCMCVHIWPFRNRSLVWCWSVVVALATCWRWANSDHPPNYITHTHTHTHTHWRRTLYYVIPQTMSERPCCSSESSNL